MERGWERWDGIYARIESTTAAGKDREGWKAFWNVLKHPPGLEEDKYVL